MNKNFNSPYIYLIICFVFLSACGGGGGGGTTREHSPENFRLINASPEISAIDFDLNNVFAAEEIAYGESSGFLEAPEGTEVILKVKSNLQVLPILESTLAIKSSSTTSSFFIGAPKAYELVTVTESFPTNTEGKVSLRVANMSPTEASVDVYLLIRGTDIEDSAPLASAVAYKSVGTYVQFDPGLYAIVYTTAGTTKIVREVAGFQFLADRGYTHLLLDKFNGGKPLTSRILEDF